jgi:hypothetical protein
MSVLRDRLKQADAPQLEQRTSTQGMSVGQITRVIRQRLGRLGFQDVRGKRDHIVADERRWECANSNPSWYLLYYAPWKRPTPIAAEVGIALRGMTDHLRRTPMRRNLTSAFANLGKLAQYQRGVP